MARRQGATEEHPPGHDRAWPLSRLPTQRRRRCGPPPPQNAAPAANSGIARGPVFGVNRRGNMKWFVRGDLDGFCGFLIEHRFAAAAAWLAAAAALAATGVIHAYTLTAAGVANRFAWLAAPEFGASYAAAALLMFALHRFRPRMITSGYGGTD